MRETLEGPRRAVRTPESVERTRFHLDTIREALRSDRAIAELLGVNPSQVSRWRKGQAPDPDTADLLAGVSLVVEMLSRMLHNDAVEDWLRGMNAHLQHRSPAYMLRMGRVTDVIGAIESMKAGAYA
jgi:transcriptional regulator with XRE-family HTH domain